MEANNKNNTVEKSSELGLIINKISKTYEAINILKCVSGQVDIIKCISLSVLLSAHIYITTPLILQLNGQSSSLNLKNLIRPSYKLNEPTHPFKRKCGHRDLKCLQRQAEHAAARYKLNAELFKRIITIESRWRVNAYNADTSDYGLGQINEITAISMGLSTERLLKDSLYALEASAAVLAHYRDRYEQVEPNTWFCRYNIGNRKLPRACRAYLFKVGQVE